MIHCNKSHNRISLLCILLVMLSLTGLLFPIEKQINTYADTNTCQISAVMKDNLPSALMKKTTLTNPFANSIKITENKNGKNGQVTVRLLVLGFVLALFSLFVLLLHFYYSQIIGLVRQRLSIIIYIHNSDGRKRLFPSCT